MYILQHMTTQYYTHRYVHGLPVGNKEYISGWCISLRDTQEAVKHDMSCKIHVKVV